MQDPRVEKLADLLVNYSVAVKKGDRVAIFAPDAARPLADALFVETLKAGGFPIAMAWPAQTAELLFKYGTREQIEYVHEPMAHITEKYDVRISVLAEENTRHLSRVDPQKMTWHSAARRHLVKTMMQRSAAGEFRWTVAPYPTNAMAQDADMSLSDYADFLFGACMPDLSDPVGYWKKFSADQQRVVDWLKGKKTVHITAPETDIKFSIEDRSWVNCDGKRNMPDGEVFTGPVEDSAEGRVYFSYPAIHQGHEITGVRLWFEKGKCVRATAEKNEDYLNKILDTDAGARCLGELAIGTNKGIKSFTREILFDEKIGGSFHMALGAGIPETGSKNESAIHWDMVCDLRQGGQITVDGKLLYKNGEFVI
ncbi:aminopeptidase [Dehalogenimonas alkenigignens]|uniref:Leucyl aminopeptidase (Aminopeptidase T) n=1 Tax=Dehalogenimonas alkenigignens TaxID=1217799 RepID=A0A0W0GG53_9CHLR|nr:aminopeptidase [Dehalogenimonas alkenigignens]KTB47538.1 Leucyl aminopeptidase (aminopeptidase T) [Dehalogenimonas alkenigignens]PVV83409.1 aminopeptidase [Dehalogenimonas alkenigignens]